MVAQETKAAPKRPAKRLMRPAKKQELPLIHGWLMQAIETSPFYNDTFKAYESARLSTQYLHRLHEVDPAHIMIGYKGEVPTGFMISSPELGSLLLQWSYVLPEFRCGTLALTALREFLDYWDNGRFHKIATYTKTDNEIALALMKRYKFDHIVTLENHIFGEDYNLFEYKLTKVTEGYDRGVSPLGTLGKIKQRILALAGR